MPWWMAVPATFLLVFTVVLVCTLLPAWSSERVVVLVAHGLLSLASPWPLPMSVFEAHPRRRRPPVPARRLL